MIHLLLLTGAAGASSSASIEKMSVGGVAAGASTAIGVGAGSSVEMDAPGRALAAGKCCKRAAKLKRKKLQLKMEWETCKKAAEAPAEGTGAAAGGGQCTQAELDAAVARAVTAALQTAETEKQTALQAAATEAAAAFQAAETEKQRALAAAEAEKQTLLVAAEAEMAAYRQDAATALAAAETEKQAALAAKDDEIAKAVATAKQDECEAGLGTWDGGACTRVWDVYLAYAKERDVYPCNDDSEVKAFNEFRLAQALALFGKSYHAGCANEFWDETYDARRMRRI